MQKLFDTFKRLWARLTGKPMPPKRNGKHGNDRGEGRPSETIYPLW
jgi:hypothetical protein